ncbi:PA14 domain-containing protein [Glaciibacter sp. 2TAF33]|uniref:PA14 domain-containing protein n=1 Tax=Glaciibacter sp. 2TAF33 TaxID=3233015 RepID=UPI003F8F55B8
MSLLAPASANRLATSLRRGGIATVAVAAMVVSLLGVSPASAIPIAEIPGNPADWASTPYSPLPAAEVKAPGNALSLDFDGAQGGIPDAADAGTGFTMVQPSTSDSTWYLPQNLAVVNGKLNITTTKGIAYLQNDPAAGNGATRNQQDNTLGTGLAATGKTLRLTTTLNSPTGAFNAAQGGLWFGPNDDNFIKVVLASPGTTAAAPARQLQISREVAGLSPSVAAYQINVDTTTATVPNGAVVTLVLDINSATLKATGSYRIGTGSLSPIGTLDIPANFIDGSLLTGTPIPGVDSFGGIFATKRNMTDATPLVYSFDSFGVAEIDNVPPAAPANLLTAPTSAGIDIGWQASPDADVAGYRVYRSATSPVSTTGPPVSGAALLADTTFTDTTTFIGSNYRYAVVAVDTSGNVSAATESAVATPPAPEGTLVTKINFSTATGPTVPGYTNDSGLAYNAGRGFGWITADDKTPFDFSLNGRVRTNAGVTTDPRLASVMHMQYGDIPTGTAANGVISEEGVWEYAVPNGQYAVVVAAGDSSAGNYDSTYVLRVEGTPTASPFVGSAAREYDESVATVNVTDGKLTIDAVGGTNTKINYAEIYQLAVAPPPAPTGLTVALTTPATVDLAWQGVGGAIGYNVFRGTTADVDTTGSALNTAPLTTTAYTDTSATAGTTYYYVVVALGNGSPASAASAPASIAIPAAPEAPAAPTNVSGSVNTADKSLLSWDAVAGSAGYNVFRGSSANVAVNGTPLNGATPVAGLSYTDTTVQPGTTYFYVVVALGSAGLNSAASAAVRVDIPDEPVIPGACLSTEWSVNYFVGTSLGGTPIVTDCVSNVNQAFPSGSGPAGVGSGIYSARFTKTINDGAGAYTFTALSDDGVRVLVDGTSVIDAWYGQSGDIARTGAVNLTDGPHTVVVEYYQGWGDAKIVVDYTKVVSACTTSEWSVDYFSGTSLAGLPVVTDCVSDINQTYAAGSGPDGVGSSIYSARFTTTIDDGAGTYSFTARSDDGVRVFVDGAAVIDSWFGQSGDVQRTGTVTLAEGPHTVVVEYYQGWGDAKIIVDYSKVVSGCSTSEWSVDYFAGTSLAGSAVKSDCFADLSQTFNDGEGPDGVGSGIYSARFVKTINEGAGAYTFSARSDDGVRVYVDGALVIDEWYGQSGNVTHTGMVTLTDGPHIILVEYYQGWGGAKIIVDYHKVVSGCTAAEWSVDYFAGTSLSGLPVVSDCASRVNQAYASGSGPAGVGSGIYSARFTKTINEGSGDYTFTATSDDGVRVYVDGTVVIDAWYGQSGDVTHTGFATLTGGPHIVVVEYYQGWGDAKIIVDYNKAGADVEAPAAPTGAVASPVNATIRLDWTPSTSSDTTGYRVYRGTTPGVTATGTPKSGTTLLTQPFYVDASVTSGTTYYYVVTAVDAAGNESAVSNEAPGLYSVTPDTEAPAAATALAAVAGNASVQLTWVASASADTIGYRVYRALEPAVRIGGTVVSGAAPVAGVSFTDPTVANGTTYFYAVTAVDLAGNESAGSNEVVAVPQVPNNTNIKVDFTATNAVPAAGYVADWGQAYGVRSSPNQGAGLSYGWRDVDGHDLSLVTNGRERGRAGVDKRLDSIVHMQYGDANGGTGTAGIKTEGVWELAVPDGLYTVTVGVGDEPGAENAYDSTHVINVEGSVGIESFIGRAAAEFTTVTTTVGVWDGRLTIDARGGTNTKIGYVDVVAIPRAPHVDTVLPDNRTTDHDVNAGVSATIRVPYAGFGVDAGTLPGNVHLYELPGGTEVPTTVGSSGGNDVISLAPDNPLKPSTSYRFVVTGGVHDNRGAAFVPFTSVFTTGTGVVEGGAGFTPLTNIAFDKVELPIGAGKYWASFAFGPDGKLYGTTIGQGLFRMTVNADGTLSNLENLGYPGMAMVGLVFDKTATAGNLKLWVTTTTANFNESGQWVSGISLLTGANLETRRQVFSELPRSLSDHLTNSMTYGPDGRIYFQQGSNQASGDLDNAWGQRGEQLLTAATLVFDPNNSQVAAAAAGGGAISVKTAQGGTYNPYAPGAPLKLYATGIRNAYDLVWHSNGHLYVATNGTAGGANTPGVTANANGTFTRVAAPGIPGFSTVNGEDVTAQCVARNYTGGSVPAVGNQPTQRDLLFDVVEGGYYGHPNPTRCEWVLNEGNDPAKPPLSPGQGGSKYPVGVKADPNYRGIAYDYEFNKSPNGSLEYKSETFGGQLKGRLVTTRFSNNNDLIFLQPDAATGKILGGQIETGITGVPNTTMQGVGGFNDPLEVVEDTKNGNLYVNQYDRSGNSQKLYLLRVPASQQAAKISTSHDEMIFSGVRNTTSAIKSITVTNGSSDQVTLTAALGGANAGDFSVVSGNGATLAAGASTTVGLRFNPGSTVGQRQAQLTLSAGTSSVTVGVYGLTMLGIEGSNEPTLQNVLGTLGYNVNVGWSNLEGGVAPTAKGDEVLEPLFVKSGTASVTMTPIAFYAPNENIPFGWYTGDGTAANQHQVGQISSAGYQSLLPPTSSGSMTSFNPGSETFGLYYHSNVFSRTGFTEDRLNTGIAHRARVYPAKNRAGTLLPNTYIIAFEDASNGDYQDYLFVATGLKPVTDTGSIDGAVKVDFTTAAGDLAAGYLRDFGQAYGPRTRPDQGSGLTFGWKDQVTENNLDLSVGGTTPGNGRDRGTVQPDVRLDSFMHMQSADVAGTFNGIVSRAFWELALPNGDYTVTVGVGDPQPSTSDPEIHQINLESTPLINLFTPTGAIGTATRHKTATATVTVTDGALTVDAIGGKNTKIGYIDVVPVTGGPVNDDPTDGAQVKVNFQTTAAPTPAGWTAETGTAYSAARGYGWLNAATGQPADRSAATRLRTAPTSGIAFPADPLLQSFAFLDNASQPTYTNGTWEYDVPNGVYSVAVSVGDAGFIDSTHGVSAEGQPVVAGFVPTGTTPFQTGVRTVTVSDGKLTITNNGTNTKINWVSIKGDGLDGPPAQPQTKINFQPAASAVPSGWQADTGQAFSAAKGYGWLIDGVPADRSVATRDRTTAASGIAFPTGDRLRQTLIITQAMTTSGTIPAGGTDGTWEYAIANGTYTVAVSVGDAGFLDSIHGIKAENTPLITDFAPTGTTPFATGSATVNVSDGKLTLTPTGVNTKLNWITIAGASLSAPAITIQANGADVGTAFSGGAANVTIAASVAGGATLASLTYRLDAGAETAYTSPLVLNTVGTHTLAVTATDNGGRQTVREVQFEILNIGGTLTLRNQGATRQGTEVVPGFYEDTLVMHRINAGKTTHTTTETATVNLGNTGTKDLRITSLALGGTSPTQFELVTPPALPLVIPPGGVVPLTAKFIATSGAKGVRSATITVASSDPAKAMTTVNLRGGYMPSPEGTNELTLPQIISLFDMTTNVGPLSDGGLGNGSENQGSPLNGEEVRSGQWKRLDPSKPVQARQLAAFHGCCTATETININGASSTHNPAWGQSVLPLNNALSGPTQLSTNPTGNFNITVAGQNTNNATFMAVKTFPVRDRNGAIVPGSWLAVHDYIDHPNQCGTGPTNCDFQDNVYLVTNVLPVTPSDTVAPVQPNGLAGVLQGTGVNLSWTARTETDLAGYRVERASAANGPWTNISGAAPLAATTFRDAALPFGNTVYYRVLAIDASGNASAPLTSISVDISSVAVPQAIRINAGGPAVTTNGVAWLADTYSTGGKTYSNPAVTQIAGTTDDVIYLTERSSVANLGTFGYAIPVPNGTYTVKLHFAEIYWGATGGGAGGTGKRVFNANLEGGPVEVNALDLNARVAPMTAYVTTNTITVTDGVLNIDFSASVNQPKVSAIEVVG